MSSRLAKETSRYLLQHADNPVDWFPWCEEALSKAREEDKPVFLSIGYSACHWCHVMAHESFADERVAAILNEHFVSIKVDREERPDLDSIYMSAVHSLTGSGGWPMSIFMTPEGKPFYGGTYFPPQPRYGMSSFTQVLLAVVEAWKQRRDRLESSGEQLRRIIADNSALGGLSANDGMLNVETLRLAETQLISSYDSVHGGWGQGIKFPQPMAIEFLLPRHRHTDDPQILQRITHELEAMARGGVYDQLGGGFHRYAVDERWLVPHFEKMLYDNAQLARVYLHAWQVTGHPLFRAIAEETLDYVAREMTDPAGGFYATQDADSEGKEGKFFLWTREEIASILEDKAAAFLKVYGVTEEGNFERQNILSLVGSWEERVALTEARQKLFRERERRVRPGRDEKVLTSWNGLMLAAFAEASWALDRDDYRRIAERNADFLLRELCLPDGSPAHHWKAGRVSDVGFLEDYTHLLEGLLALYQATFEGRWYTAACDLLVEMIVRFRASEGFYDTPDGHEALIVRPKDIQDNAVPSGNAMAACVLLQMATLSREPSYEELAHRSLRGVQSLLAQYPSGFCRWLFALDYALSAHQEIAIVGDPRAEDTRELIRVCRQGYHPHRIVAVDDGSGMIPLLRGRSRQEGRATAYVCTGYTCHAAVTDPQALATALAGRS